MWKWWWEVFWGLFRQLRPVLGILLGSLDWAVGCTQFLKGVVKP